MNLLSNHQIKSLILLIILGPFNAWAQTDADSLYQAARQASFEEKDNAKAMELIQTAVKLDSSQAHYRVFYGRLLAWEARYPEAEAQLNLVLAANPAHLDSRLALLDVSLWSGNYPQMEALAVDGQTYHPDNAEMLYRLGLSKAKMNQPKQARAVFEEVLKIDPTHEKAASELLALQPQLKDRKLRVTVTHDRLADTQTAWQFLVGEATLDPWTQAAVEYEHPAEWGPVIARISLASRFAVQGGMFEIESYPNLRKTTYAYVGLGASGSSIFPDWKIAAELFQDLGHGYEGSLGLRYLKLPQEGIGVYTASLGKYLGNYWLNVRTFLTPNNESLSRSINFQIRKYMADADQFVELSGGSGEVPDETLGTEELSYLGARRISVLWQGELGVSRYFQVRVNLENQEISAERFRGMTGMSLSIEQRF